MRLGAFEGLEVGIGLGCQIGLLIATSNMQLVVLLAFRTHHDCDCRSTYPSCLSELPRPSVGTQQSPRPWLMENSRPSLGFSPMSQLRIAWAILKVYLIKTRYCQELGISDLVEGETGRRRLQAERWRQSSRRQYRYAGRRQAKHATELGPPRSAISSIEVRTSAQRACKR